MYIHFRPKSFDPSRLTAIKAAPLRISACFRLFSSLFYSTNLLIAGAAPSIRSFKDSRLGFDYTHMRVHVWMMDTINT